MHLIGDGVSTISISHAAAKGGSFSEVVDPFYSLRRPKINEASQTILSYYHQPIVTSKCLRRVLCEKFSSNLQDTVHAVNEIATHGAKLMSGDEGIYI